MRNDKHMVLTAMSVPAGYDKIAWRLPGSRAEELGSFELLRDITVAFEDAKIDALFLADAISGAPVLRGDLRYGSPYEPLTATSALAAVTSHIGLINTISTTFNHPYTTARQLASLDLLSGGRAGWNVVTSYMAEENYGITLPDKATRYKRASEFVDVVCDLWTGWSDRAVIADRETGIWADPALVRQTRHAGSEFSVIGSLNIPRSAQGHPVIVQAGQSEAGIALAAARAELVYAAQPDRAAAIAFYRQLKDAVAAAGRRPHDVKVILGILPYIGDTAAEARDFQMTMTSMIDFETLRRAFSQRYGVDLSGIDLDQNVPAERFDARGETAVAEAKFFVYKRMAEEEGLRDMLLTFEAAIGHIIIAGTADEVADFMVTAYEEHACDGFNLNPPAVPESIGHLCKRLVPALQERGYAKSEYKGTTLRENLGLPFPRAWDDAERA